MVGMHPYRPHALTGINGKVPIPHLKYSRPGSSARSTWLHCALARLWLKSSAMPFASSCSLSAGRSAAGGSIVCGQAGLRRAAGGRWCGGVGRAPAGCAGHGMIRSTGSLRLGASLGGPRRAAAAQAPQAPTCSRERRSRLRGMTRASRTAARGSGRGAHLALAAQGSGRLPFTLATNNCGRQRAARAAGPVRHPSRERAAGERSVAASWVSWYRTVAGRQMCRSVRSGRSAAHDEAAKRARWPFGAGSPAGGECRLLQLAGSHCCSWRAHIDVAQRLGGLGCIKGFAAKGTFESRDSRPGGPVGAGAVGLNRHKQIRRAARQEPGTGAAHANKTWRLTGYNKRHTRVRRVEEQGAGR